MHSLICNSHLSFESSRDHQVLTSGFAVHVAWQDMKGEELFRYQMDYNKSGDERVNSERLGQLQQVRRRRADLFLGLITCQYIGSARQKQEKWKARVAGGTLFKKNQVQGAEVGRRGQGAGGRRVRVRGGEVRCSERDRSKVSNPSHRPAGKVIYRRIVQMARHWHPDLAHAAGGFCCCPGGPHKGGDRWQLAGGRGGCEEEDVSCRSPQRSLAEFRRGWSNEVPQWQRGEGKERAGESEEAICYCTEECLSHCKQEPVRALSLQHHRLVHHQVLLDPSCSPDAQRSFERWDVERKKWFTNGNEVTYKQVQILHMSLPLARDRFIFIFAVLSLMRQVSVLLPRRPDRAPGEFQHVLASHGIPANQRSTIWRNVSGGGGWRGGCDAWRRPSGGRRQWSGVEEKGEDNRGKVGVLREGCHDRSQEEKREDWSTA